MPTVGMATGAPAAVTNWAWWGARGCGAAVGATAFASPTAGSCATLCLKYFNRRLAAKHAWLSYVRDKCEVIEKV